MKFTGRNLQYIVWALEDALREVQNTIATCPDPVEYEDDLLDAQFSKKIYEKLLRKAHIELHRYYQRKQNG